MSGSRGKKPLHQPPNGADLRRHPPSGSECARMRGLMRDFVDGELEAVTRDELENHVHGCRSCGLALARAEHELLQVHSAFGEQTRDECGPQPGFGDEILRRLVQDVGMDQENTPAHAASSRPAGRAAKARSLAGLPLSLLGTLLAGSALLTCLLLIQIWILGGDSGPPQRVARLVITSSVDTQGLFGGRKLQLMPGDGLGDDQLLWVGERGAAQADWHDASEKNQPAATFQMDGNAAMRLQDGAPMLVNGKLQVSARRSVEISLGDGSRLELSAGEYVLMAEDESLDQPWDPLLGAPGELRVAVEVLDGDGAQIVRADAPPIFVGPGSIGIYGGESVDIKPGPGVRGPVAQGGRDPIPNNDPTGSFGGMVWERNGLPAIGSEVLVAYARDGLVHPVSVTVAASGHFRFPTGGPGQAPNCDSSFAVVQVMPPVNRLDLALTVPEAYRVVANEFDSRLQQSLILESSSIYEGLVVAEDGTPQAGVRLLPCIVDEVFGTVMPWITGQVTTNATGGFRLARLPARLPDHQALVLVIEHPDFATTVAPVPVRGSVAAHRMGGRLVIRDRQYVRLRALPPNAVMHVWQDVVGLPPGTAAQIYTVQTDEVGDAVLWLAADGRVWMRGSSLSPPMLRELKAVSGSVSGVYEPVSGGSAVPLGSVFHTQQQIVPGTGLALSSNYRHEAVGVSGQGGDDRSVRLLDEQSGLGIQGAEVFIVDGLGPRGRGTVRFVGFTGVTGTIAYDSQPGDRAIVGIAPGGALAWLDQVAVEAPNSTIRVPAVGRATLGVALQPPPGAAEQVVVVKLEATVAHGGLRPVLYRFASDAGDWQIDGVPAGEYDVTVGEYRFLVEIVPGAIAVLQ